MNVADESVGLDGEPAWFRFSATLRVFGQGVDLDEITATLGLAPTHTHRRGDRRTPRAQPFEHDMWSYTAPVPGDKPLDDHIQTLWSRIKPHKDYLMGLKEGLTVNVYCGYTTNCCAGFEVSHRSLALFVELEIPFGVSIIA